MAECTSVLEEEEVVEDDDDVDDDRFQIPPTPSAAAFRPSGLLLLWDSNKGENNSRTFANNGWPCS
jgi:hypothetical protein